VDGSRDEAAVFIEAATAGHAGSILAGEPRVF
jgi:hypothetical protein